MANKNYDFCGWATRANIRCADGRVISSNAFKDCDGITVPLCWGHDHSDPTRVLGHALLENREDGVYAYCSFNDTELGNTAKELVQHGDIAALSIYANHLKQQGNLVVHGAIRELSLVLAGANPGAFIEDVIEHDDTEATAAYIYNDDENLVLEHSDNPDNDPKDPEQQPNNKEDKKDPDDKTIAEILDTLTEEQTTAVAAVIGSILEGEDPENNNSEGGETMKHNIFDNEDVMQDTVLSHADEEAIVSLAKSKSVGSLQEAIGLYFEQNKDTLAHGIDDIETLFPDFKDVYPGAPEQITRDNDWVASVINGAEKSPISRIRTRQADVRGTDLRGLGYKKGDKKADTANVKLLGRTTDPQTIYVKDALHRDDIIDIIDFDVVEYQYGVMSMLLNEEIALSILIGDGREEGDKYKVEETHVRSIWNDDDLYTIHTDVDIAAAKKELQGTNTGANFGDNYIYAEAVVTAGLYAREKYKGSGSLTFYCTPHLLNVMLLARDLNGRRIYDSKSDLAAALNVSDIQTVEQFEGKVRTDKQQKKHKLLGLFVNMKDYRIGATKGGEITKFNQFDIDFNQEKFLMETRMSGALTRVFSAIALEEPVDTASGSGSLGE